MQYIFIVGFALYLIFRAMMRLSIVFELKKKFGKEFAKISVLPSMTGLLRWHFILGSEECNVIGEKNFLTRSIKIVQTLNKLQAESLDKILFSPVGNFFKEFTPLSHVACEKAGSITRYIFIDMRYYIKNNFLHHAILELDEADKIVKASFNPYSIKRSNDIPL